MEPSSSDYGNSDFFQIMENSCIYTLYYAVQKPFTHNRQRSMVSYFA
jgi:hypothetical protein